MSKEEEQSTESASAPESAPTTVSQSLDQHAAPEVVDFFRKNGLAILVGVAVAVIGYVGFSIYKNVGVAKEQEAMSLLMNAQAREQLQRVVDSYPGTAANPLARLALAAGLFDEGQYVQAREQYQQFIAAHPDHEFIGNAEIGVAQIDEASLNLEEALRGYEDFIARRPAHYLYPVAVFGKGRVLEQMRRFDDAVATYQVLIDEDPESDWAARAESNIEFAEMARRALERGDTLPPVTTLPSFQ